MAVNPAAQAASVVLAATRPMPSKSIAESVLPGLNPYQPNHRIRPPVTAIDKSGAADHGSGSDRRAGVCEGELEDPYREERHASRFVGRRRTLQEEPVISNESVAVAEHEGKADGIKEDAAKTGIYNAFHKHV